MGSQVDQLGWFPRGGRFVWAVARCQAGGRAGSGCGRTDRGGGRLASRAGLRLEQRFDPVLVRELCLDLDQAGIGAIEVHQFRVRALLGESSLLEDEDAVRVFQRGKPVGNGDGRAAAGQHAERVLNRLLRFGVHTAGRLVENQHAGVVQQGPGDRQSLPLASRQSRPPLAHPGVVSQGLLEDELMGLRGTGRRQRLFTIRTGATVNEVVEQGAPE